MPYALCVIHPFILPISSRTSFANSAGSKTFKSPPNWRICILTTRKHCRRADILVDLKEVLWRNGMERITQIDKSGTLNLSKEVIEPLGCQEDDKLMVFSSKSAIVIKKIGSASLGERFERLADDVGTQFKKRGVTEEDVQEAVRWGRR
jgi:hypothetical protein